MDGTQITIWKAAIYLPDESHPEFGYVEIHEKNVPESFYNQFKWDRINRIDFFEERKHMILFAANKDTLAAFINGFYAFQKLDKDFSEETKQKWLDSYNKNVKPTEAIKIL